MTAFPPSPFSNSVQINSSSKHEGVRTNLYAATPWIEKYALSPLLDQYEIFHMGVVVADAKYRVSRVESPYTHFLACLSGEAILWSNGKDYRLRAGAACLLPKGSSHADQACGAEPWRFCYVCYLHRRAEPGFRGVQYPIVAEYDPIPLYNTIETLRHECSCHADTECQRQLLGLVHHFVLRFTSQHQPDERLTRLWERVTAAPAEDWSLDALEREAHCHREHLRRLCHRYWGRSPAQQVAFIRMQRAAALLRTTSWTLQHIANEVGYTDAFSFSNAFKSWFKVCPTKYRAGE
ncbi:MAG: AraC family transcriptional regulator [Verrucomicrobiaceae bacterium]|nr:MAG: AraC family transcriptional regulator [Verrucomicrobiaceae bacterium]